MAKKLFWCSWYQPTRDYRPTQFPPTENILAWWKSGESMNGTSVLCAWVQADDLDDLVEQVNSSWGEITGLDQFRFYDEYEKYAPCDRFPIEQYDWMIERLEKWK